MLALLAYLLIILKKISHSQVQITTGLASGNLVQAVFSVMMTLYRLPYLQKFEHPIMHYVMT